MKKALIIATCAAGIIMISNGCYSGLKRTNLTRWEIKKIPELGIYLELPSQPERVKCVDRNHTKKEWRCKFLSFSLHPVHPEVLAEPVYLINFRLVMFDKTAYELYLTKEHAANADRRFENTNYHDEVTEFNSSRPYDMAGSITLRRDFKNPKTGDVVLAAATYIPDAKKRDEDIAAIKRILNSIEFLDADQQ